MTAKKTIIWISASGEEVPSKFVPSRDKKATALVARHLKAAEALSSRLAALKVAVLADVEAFVDWSSEASGVKTAGGAKGNVDLTSFDGLTQIRIRKPEYIEFDERLMQAKSLIDQFLETFSGDEKGKLITRMINAAFTTTRDGRLRAEAICAVQRRIHLSDPLWVRAMQLIEQSKQAIKAKTYIRFYRRQDTESDWKLVELDIANA